MSAKNNLNEKLMKDFAQRMIAAQDVMRGIPESRITDIEAAHRRLERAFIESNAAMKKTLEESDEICKASLNEIDKLDQEYVSIRPRFEEIRRILEASVGICVCTCCIRDFQLPFINGIADTSFGTESPVTDVEQGIVGWGSHSNPPPKISNTGSGDGQLINGNLDLYWRTTVPHDGIFAMRPNQNRSSFAVFGSHKVRGRGYYFSSNDASVEVHAWVIVYLDFQWLEARHIVVSTDATRSENRTKSFGRWVDLPGRITFQAQAGQELGMIVRLYGKTWANDEGLAEINVDLFGVPSNWLNDMHIDVLD